MDLRAKGINLIYSVVTGSRQMRMVLTPIAALSYALFAGSFVILSMAMDRWLDLSPLPGEPLNLYLAIPLIGLGAVLTLWCQKSFLKAKGTPVPFNPPPALVTSGPYAYCRNPMLSGLFLLLFGLGAALQSVSLLFFFTPLFILINVLELKLIEEPELRMRLGSAYLEYQARTPMFMPDWHQLAKSRKQ